MQLFFKVIRSFTYFVVLLMAGLCWYMPAVAAVVARGDGFVIDSSDVEAQKAFTGAVESLTKNAPAGSESAVAAFKNALTAGQTALESLQVQAKNAVETAQSNIAAATTQTVDAVKKATKKA